MPPVEVTTALASPATTKVPIQTIFDWSAMATFLVKTMECLLTGKDSPVREASWVLRFLCSIILASAGILSPSSINKTSPGTTSEASTSTKSPLL